MNQAPTINGEIVGVQFIEPEKCIGNGLDESSPYNYHLIRKEIKWKSKLLKG